MDRLNSMAVFAAVVERGGFAPAALDAGISATMVARHVQALESRLGARLLYRTTRRQSLTDTGQLYYRHCKTLLAAVEAAEASVGELQAMPRGILRVTAPVTFGTRRLAPALAEFLRRYPEVNVDLSLDDRVVDLLGEGFEAAIRIGTQPDSQWVARPLAPYRSLLCASPEYLRRRGRPQVPEDLAAHDCLGFSFSRNGGRWRLSEHGEERSLPIVPRLKANNGEALRQAALAGIGIVLQPEALLMDDVRQRRLVQLLPRWSPPARKMQLIYRRDRQATPKLRRFIEFVVERFGVDA